MNREAQVNVRMTKRVELVFSSVKLKGGTTLEMVKSWMREKSSMLFCRSRMLRKKSFERSGAGLIFGAGARGGPPRKGDSRRSWGVGFGGGGCRVRKEGIIM